MKKSILRTPNLLLFFYLTCGSSLSFATGHVAPAEEGDVAAEFMGMEVCELCHEGMAADMGMNTHAQTADGRTPFALEGCESCHGAGSIHVEQEGVTTGGMLGFRTRTGEPVTKQNNVCLECHARGILLHWQGSLHESRDVACTDCHRIHGTDKVIDRNQESGVCYACHAKIRAKTYQPYGHPLRDGKMRCSDCHNPHGAIGEHELDQITVNENCYTCHYEKRGPFLWEHFPVTEDCTLCHDVHGSSHRGALKRRPPHLCQECHMQAGAANHIRRTYDFDTSDTLITRALLGHGCMNCHSRVHGSNHPSGAKLMR